MKDEQRLNEQKRKHNKNDNNSKKGSSNEISCTSSEEVKITFDDWLRRKREQSEKEKEMQRNLEKLEHSSGQKEISAEERSKVFKEYVIFLILLEIFAI